MAIHTIDQLATISEMEQLWQLFKDNANIVEIISEGGNKMERVQIVRGHERIELFRVWRNNQPSLTTAVVKALAERW